LTVESIDIKIIQAHAVNVQADVKHVSLPQIAQHAN